MTSRRATLAVLVLALAAPFVLPGVARAADCPGSLEQEFLPWLDVAHYRIAPGGGFEGANKNWRFSKEVRKVGVNEPFFLRKDADTRSVVIPKGGVVRSPNLCVALADPTIRFVARNRGSLLGLLRVDVFVQTPDGALRIPAGVVAGTSAWAPSPLVPLLANLTAPLASEDGTARVSVRFKAVGVRAKWQIDDVYVDPFRSR